MSSHRYSPWTVSLDGLRAGFGMTVTIGPLLFLNVALPLALVFGVLGTVFFLFGLRISIQALSSIELSDRGIARHGPLARHLDWSDMTALSLAHFALPRRPSQGWYQLTLKGNRGGLKIDSTINGFDDIVSAAVEAAGTRGLAFDPTTGENLKRLGHGHASSPLPIG